MSEKRAGPHPPAPSPDSGEGESCSDGGEGFKPTELGDLPAEWEVLLFKEMATLQRGKDLPTRKRKDGPYPIIGSNGIVGYHNEFVSENGVTVGRSGSVGKLFYEPGKFWPLNTALWIKDFHGNDSRYVYYFLHTFDFQKYATGVSVPTLNRNYVHDVKIPLPPLDEQRKIAHILNTVQQAIAAQDDLIAAAQEVKRSLMRRLFTYGPGPEPAPTKETEIGEVPKHWGVVELGDIARIERGKFAHRPRNAPQFYGGKIPFIQTGDVAQANGRITAYSQTLNELGLSISRMFPKGTIVITIAANIGFTGILGFDSAFPDSLIAITPDDSINNVFLEYYLQTQQPKMDKMAPRGTQKNINIQFLKPWPTPKPSLSEQHQIAHILQTTDAKIAAEQDRRTALLALFNSLLQELMTGRLRVNRLEFST